MEGSNRLFRSDVRATQVSKSTQKNSSCAQIRLFWGSRIFQILRNETGWNSEEGTQSSHPDRITHGKHASRRGLGVDL